MKPKRTRLFPLFILLLAFGGLILAVFWFMVSPVSASLFATPIPTHENVWAYADIAKPTYTAIPAVIAVGTPTIQSASIIEEPSVEESVDPLPSVDGSVEPPGVMVMEIVENAPIPAYQEPQQPSGNPSYSYSGSKYILVDISEQHMYVYEGDVLVYSFVASTGINNATRAGTFAVQSKIPNAYGSTWNIWMPSWLGIYWSGGLENGIHALPILPNGATLWEGYLGRPVSYGCVVLGTFEAQLLYDWAEIGTPVEIQW
jgi:lipoprotein-anchoring transpeptidase ErfK/SrfK